jgi:DNA-directed RNA polymerase beta subunit
MDPNPLFRAVRGRPPGGRPREKREGSIRMRRPSGQKRLPRNYGKIREVLEMPNLIEVQKSSYDLFLNSGDAASPTDGEGIRACSSRSSRSRISTRPRCSNS